VEEEAYFDAVDTPYADLRYRPALEPLSLSMPEPGIPAPPPASSRHTPVSVCTHTSG